MPNPPRLLNDDGTASISTLFMMSHHAFRRDLQRFGIALKEPSPTASRAEALRGEWGSFRAALHGHHHMEDTAIFPSMAAEHQEAAPVIEGLTADHRKIDPLLEQGDRAFAELPGAVDAAARVVRELVTLLDPHLALEEEKLIPFLREAKGFPTPPTDADAAMYADGFAWSMHGIAPEVLDKVYPMLPEILSAKLPAARAAFEERCKRVWGTFTPTASRTPIPGA